MKLRASLVQSIVVILNWECLGHITEPPDKARSGVSFSDAQWDMIERLERLVDYFLQPGDLTSGSLGRSAEKFSSLLQASQELPGYREVDLYEFVSHVASELDPYGTSASSDIPGDPHDSNNDGKNPLETCSQETKCKPSSVARPVIADRIKWEHSPAFDPVPFFEDQIVRDAFIDPARVKTPESSWVPKRRAKVHCSRQELLSLASKWDQKGACRIFRVDEVQWDECVGLFAVPKDEQFDRLILNPQVANSRMKSFSHYTKELAPGSMFSLIWLPQGNLLRISADDLAEMYYTIKVPEARAKRNSIGCVFSADELQSFNCFDPTKHVGRCVVALNALAMGDSWAVEFAQQSHHNVLRCLAGSMLEHERVAYRKAFPRSSFLEWLSIDDHIGVQVVSDQQFKNQEPLRDTVVFARAEEAYKQVGLVQHPRKKQRGVTSGIFLGAEIDGRLGLVSAPRHRIGALMLCTIVIARKGFTSPRILSSVLGSWIHVLMFRRPILSILSHVFSEGQQVKQDTIFELSREARNELWAVSLLGPVCISDLRVDIAPFIYCTDASPSGGGICVVEESRPVVAELWRHSEQRGYYTQLLNPAATVLSELGLDHVDPLPEVADPCVLDNVIRVPSPLHEGYVYDTLELFRGEGNWTSAHADLGMTVHGGVDVRGRHVVFADMLDNSVFHQLCSLALRRVVRDWHAGPECKTYGTLRRPRLRSKTQPAGFRLNDPLTREHTLLALRTAFLMHIVVSLGEYFSVEQPGSSVMFHLDVFRRLVHKGCVITVMHFCAFGSPFKKPSKWLHNKPWLLDLNLKCRCSSPSQHFH